MLQPHDKCICIMHFSEPPVSGQPKKDRIGHVHPHPPLSKFEDV